jgi:hypothetical protein
MRPADANHNNRDVLLLPNRRWLAPARYLQAKARAPIASSHWASQRHVPTRLLSNRHSATRAFHSRPSARRGPIGHKPNPTPKIRVIRAIRG